MKRPFKTDDILAGLTGAVAGAPQAMGFALLAGISPIYGLYSVIAATIVGGITTASSFMTVAPTNALALVVGSVLIAYPESSYPEHLITLSLLVGAMMVLAGVLKLGFLTRFVSNAVMTGFITGAGLLIIIGQLSHMTDIEYDSQQPLIRVVEWLTKIGDTHFPTFVVGTLTMIIIVSVHNTRFRNIAVLVALVVTTVLVAIAGWDDVPLVRDMAPIPNALPGFKLPTLTGATEFIIPALAMTVSTVRSVSRWAAPRTR